MQIHEYIALVMSILFVLAFAVRVLTVTVSLSYGEYTEVRIGLSIYQISLSGDVVEEGPFCTFCVTDSDTIYTVHKYADMLDNKKSITLFRLRRIK